MEIVSGYAQVDGTRLYYECAGEGEPVVLLHTGNGNTTIWDGQFEDLASDHRVIRYDMRGFGRSSYPASSYLYARDLAGLLSHLGVDRAHIVGPSLGGRVAVEFCLLYPSMTASLLLVAPVIREHNWSEDVISARIAEEEAFGAGDFEAATQAMMRNWVLCPGRHPEDLDQSMLERIRAAQHASYLVRLRTRKEAGAEPDEEELDSPAGSRLSSIAAPTMVLIGGADGPDSTAIGERLASEIHGAQKQVIEGVGHMIAMERPEDFLRIARDFLRAAQRR